MTLQTNINMLLLFVDLDIANKSITHAFCPILRNKLCSEDKFVLSCNMRGVEFDPKFVKLISS